MKSGFYFIFCLTFDKPSAKLTLFDYVIECNLCRFAVRWEKAMHGLSPGWFAAVYSRRLLDDMLRI